MDFILCQIKPASNGFDGLFQGVTMLELLRRRHQRGDRTKGNCANRKIADNGSVKMTIITGTEPPATGMFGFGGQLPFMPTCEMLK